jgi:hypothetical protein
LEGFLRDGYARDEGHVTEALHRTRRSVTQALLLPFAPKSDLLESDVSIEPIVLNRLRTVVPASPLHFALVEIVRRRYRHVRQAEDAADKVAVREAQELKSRPGAATGDL